jgi:hypothetical protein
MRSVSILSPREEEEEEEEEEEAATEVDSTAFSSRKTFESDHSPPPCDRSLLPPLSGFRVAGAAETSSSRCFPSTGVADFPQKVVISKYTKTAQQNNISRDGM